MPWPNDTTQKNPLQLPGPLPQPDDMGGQEDDTAAPGPSSAPAGDASAMGKMDTPLGPITPPHPEVVAKSGGLGGYLKGVVSRLPKALAILESSYGNSAPLQAIEQEEARAQQAKQQEFANTITAQRETRAQQLFQSQLENFKSEIAYRAVQKQLEENKITEQHQLQTAREIIQNAASTPDDIQRAHRILQSYGVEKPEPEQYVTGADGQMYRLPKTGTGGPPIATPVMRPETTPNPMMQPNFVGPVPPGTSPTVTRNVPLVSQMGPKDDVAEDFRRGVADGRYTNDEAGWAQAVHNIALQKHIVDPNAAQSKADTRVDRSYQFHTGRLETVAKPIEDRLGRMANLFSSLQANNPQADSLVAPELLTAMAGGQGSGLRMNEAEISRIVGGRTQWESIKSKVNAWHLDPSKPFLLTDEQRKQVYKLLQVVSQRSIQQTGILREAQSQIAMSEDPQEHKRIYAETRKKIDDIMLGALQEPNRPTAPPKGAKVVDMTH